MERKKGFREDLKGKKALERIGRGKNFREDLKGGKACGEDWKWVGRLWRGLEGEKSFGEDWKGDPKKGSGKDWKRKKKATCSLLQ